MSSDRVIVDTIKVAQDLLRQNLPPMHSLTDAATVLRLRELVNSPSIRSALDRSSDTILAFALRAVERALCDHSRPHRQTIDRLWDILEDPQYAALDTAVTVDDPDLGPLRLQNVPFRLSRSPGAVRFAGRRHGEDTDTVLAEAGLSAEEVATLRAAGVV